MANKTMIIPQNAKSPEPSMLNKPSAKTTRQNTTPRANSKKKSTSLNIDEKIYTDFKVYCAKNGKSISGLIEEAMVQIMKSR